ncbi:His Kinase A (phospho-acceptor) domain-containing protein [Filimonas lacunae]|uniref:histidine kinase n=1 Tax=Filimonas lacunae TaxID=477680 RepID=A0A173MRD3_9BACT|nr:ATP-binding protein [Filimonas lacunae]BAV10066.1 sensor histidine kinase [Filimonas lacunae]SIS83481.1 His Kinase A (phospho-acceptor) domain-containing protein [Filimonas lacunae]
MSIAEYFRKKHLTFITLVSWFLLFYIIAALVFWFISLETQNKQMYVFRVSELKKDDPTYYNKVLEFDKARRLKSFQYIGEGSTFLCLILVGAVFVYRATKRQIVLSHQQQNFMMAVTHELKTPIAVARLNLETLLKRKLEEPQREKLLRNTLQETNRLNELCNNILVSAQLEAGGYRLNRQELNFSQLAEDVLDDCVARYPQRIFVPAIQTGIYVEGEQLLLQLLVSNLLENALKYSAKDKPVQVSLEVEGKWAKLSVADEGAGIPDEEKKKIFTKFYRIGNENTRSTKGTGLGLYLCKKIAIDHKGSIGVKNNTPQGSIFTVTLQSV